LERWKISEGLSGENARQHVMSHVNEMARLLQ
jgi:hypothetical protein